MLNTSVMCLKWRFAGLTCLVTILDRIELSSSHTHCKSFYLVRPHFLRYNIQIIFLFIYRLYHNLPPWLSIMVTKLQPVKSQVFHYCDTSFIIFAFVHGHIGQEIRQWKWDWGVNGSPLIEDVFTEILCHMFIVCIMFSGCTSVICWVGSWCDLSFHLFLRVLL